MIVLATASGNQAPNSSINQIAKKLTISAMFINTKLFKSARKCRFIVDLVGW